VGGGIGEGVGTSVGDMEIRQENIFLTRCDKFAKNFLF
jgi:hypothetical protein